MSNTSSTAMMLPIAFGLVSEQYPRFRVFLILGTAYCANIGGLATIVGSPPNAIAAAVLNVDFMQWMQVSLPTTLMMFPTVIACLYWVISPEKDAVLMAGENHEPIVWCFKAKSAVLIFIFTVIAWFFSKQIGEDLGVTQFDRLVAIAITALSPALGLIEWKVLERHIDWGILILFGAGLCLSSILSLTGASEWLAQAMLVALEGSADWIIILSCIGLMITLTELASNTGSAAILIPIIFAMSNEFNPAITYTIIFGVGLAATCAFMLPVATHQMR